MTEILAVFRSRVQAAECNAWLAAQGIKVKLVSTPAEIKTGCGLSVKFAESAYKIVLAHIMRAGYTTFSGFARAGQSGRYYLNR